VTHWVSLLLQRVELVERQQREATAQARQLVVEELVTVLAHDLGNYLTPLLGTIHLLARRAAREGHITDVQLTERAARSVELVHRLTTDLLDASRVKHGLLQLHRQPIDLADLVRNTTDDCARRKQPWRSRDQMNSSPTWTLTASGKRWKTCCIMPAPMHPVAPSS
jgi:K+-sensing histidine kinase KdpD